MKNSSHTYFESLLELLQIEKQEDLAQYKKNVLDRNLTERVQKGYTWYPLDLKRISIGTGEKVILELKRNAAKKGQAIHSGDSVTVFGMLSDHEVGKTAGVVSAINQNFIKVALSLEYVPDWLSKAQLGVNLEFDDKTYQEMEKAVRKVMKPEANKRLAELREVLLGNKKPSFHKWNVTYKNDILNPSQNAAVQRILESEDVAIIHGPPGTGKTTTLIQAIKETLHREHQVLVCAPSNTAVDLLTLRCQQEGMGVIRIGNPARIDEDLHKLTLDGAITQHDDYRALRKLRKDGEAIRKQALKFKRNFGEEQRRKRQSLLKEARELRDLAHQLEDYIIHQLLNRTQVICSTLTGAANKIIGGKKFHTVFIDEAGQALEPSCWIPITKAGRVILAGDHFQLPPTVKSIEADKKGMSITLFEKLISRENQSISVLLEYQYRMHEQIMEFSGRQFYEGRLKADPSVKYRKLGEDFPAVEFVDTAGCGFMEKTNPETKSTSNKEEAQLVLRHLATLISRLETKAPGIFEQPLSIGIIAPYRQQVKVLESQLAESPMLSQHKDIISINSVDGFQGQERDIMYISLVRANTRGQIGFLKDIRRINVALTRARKFMAVIGDSGTVGQHPFYQQMLDYMEEIGAYRSAWDYVEG